MACQPRPHQVSRTDERNSGSLPVNAEETRVNGEPNRLAILEALLFVAEDPLPLAKLQEILVDTDAADTEASLRDLAVRLETDGRGLMVQEVAGGFRLATRPEMHAWVQQLQQVKPARLSRAALETLAIIAYRQPITRAEVEAIRGVAVDGVLRTLLERDLVRMMGRKAEAGRPILYGTSVQFLEHFGLRELGDLPTLREINELIGIAESGSDVDASAQRVQVAADTEPPLAGPEQAAEGAVLGTDDGSASSETEAADEPRPGDRSEIHSGGEGGSSPDQHSSESTT
jgi:segregation and condensation protein B